MGFSSESDPGQGQGGASNPAPPWAGPLHGEEDWRRGWNEIAAPESDFLPHDECYEQA